MQIKGLNNNKHAGSNSTLPAVEDANQRSKSKTHNLALKTIMMRLEEGKLSNRS